MLDTKDRDTEAVIELLRVAVTESGLPQAAFARALGTSAPRLSTYLSGETRPSAHFVVRSRRIGRALGRASALGWMSAPITASQMRDWVLAHDTEWTWRMLLQGRDHLTWILGESDRELLAAWEAKPSSTGSLNWDALLGAVVAHEYQQFGIEAPRWAMAEPLDMEWLPHHPFLTPDRVRAQTPEWLKSRNIYVPARDLVTA